MKDIHKKLYAILMGDVSETITFMECVTLQRGIDSSNNTVRTGNPETSLPAPGERRRKRRPAGSSCHLNFSLAGLGSLVKPRI